MSKNIRAAHTDFDGKTEMGWEMNRGGYGKNEKSLERVGKYEQIT